MGALITNQGLIRVLKQAFESTNYDAARNIQTIAVDDATEAFLAADTKLNDGTGFTQEFDQALTSTPTESGQTITHVTTLATGSANFTIKRISLHDDTAANVSGSSTTLFGGVDGQSLTKTTDFTLTITLKLTYANNGAANTLVVNQGLLRAGQQTSESTNYNAARNFQTMSFDDQASAFQATDVDLDRAGGLTVANMFDAAFTSTPTESGQTVTCVANIPTGSGNFEIKRIAIHDDTAANVTTASNTLAAGVDGKSLTKTSDLSMDVTLVMTASNQTKRYMILG